MRVLLDVGVRGEGRIWGVRRLMMMMGGRAVSRMGVGDLRWVVSSFSSVMVRRRRVGLRVSMSVSVFVVARRLVMMRLVRRHGRRHEVDRRRSIVLTLPGRGVKGGVAVEWAARHGSEVRWLLVGVKGWMARWGREIGRLGGDGADARGVGRGVDLARELAVRGRSLLAVKRRRGVELGRERRGRRVGGRMSVGRGRGRVKGRVGRVKGWGGVRVNGRERWATLSEVASGLGSRKRRDSVGGLLALERLDVVVLMEVLEVRKLLVVLVLLALELLLVLALVELELLKVRGGARWTGRDRRGRVGSRVRDRVRVSHVRRLVIVLMVMPVLGSKGRRWMGGMTRVGVWFGHERARRLEREGGLLLLMGMSVGRRGIRRIVERRLTLVMLGREGRVDVQVGRVGARHRTGAVDGRRRRVEAVVRLDWIRGEIR
jgi:hypothetical protein